MCRRSYDAKKPTAFIVFLDGGGHLGDGIRVPVVLDNRGVRAVAQDSIGQVYFATPRGVQMCEANGRMAPVFNPPAHGEVSSIVFAGEKTDWM
jgi:hypothetical protein